MASPYRLSDRESARNLNATRSAAAFDCNHRCPELTVTNNWEKLILCSHSTMNAVIGLLAHRNKIAVFTRGGDDIFSNSTRELGNAVKDACVVMMKAKK